MGLDDAQPAALEPAVKAVEQPRMVRALPAATDGRAQSLKSRDGSAILAAEKPSTRYGAMNDIQAPDLSHWWHDDEMESCPTCGNMQLTPPSPSMVGMRVCLTCGIVNDPQVAS
jgi:hypothetical protein